MRRRRAREKEREMSLVDYASSDDDEPDVREEQRHPSDIAANKATVLSDNRPTQQPVSANERPLKLSKQQSDSSLRQSETSMIRLPDASLLLDSPAMPSNVVGSYDHSSRVAAAMAENASRKRESKESTSTFPRSKVPRGSLPHSKGVPDTVGGLLRPPQLSGRSNVVTEDISKLFVRKAESSSN